jgi:hypothetical protein
VTGPCLDLDIRRCECENFLLTTQEGPRAASCGFRAALRFYSPLLVVDAPQRCANTER